MKAEFQAKFLQHLAQKKQDKGFTLIELLVVIIIIGILSAIALPSFLNQANKARESEAKQYVGTMNRTQQAYYLEHPTGFTTDITLLGLGIKTASTNYTYGISNAGSTSVANVSYPLNTATLRAYTGVVQVGQTAATGGETTTLAAVCYSTVPAAGNPAGAVPSTTAGQGPTCATGWQFLGQ
jgi:prepilin-type N-terminal cleavage/methylation domain-containing protein